MTTISNNSPLQLTVNPAQKPFWSENAAAPQEDGPSFWDFLDIINPLQHIPVVSDIYQSLTGDTQSTGAKLAGGALFGGPVGFIASLIDSIVEQESGKSISGNMLAMVANDEETELASAAPVAYQQSSQAYLKTAALL